MAPDTPEAAQGVWTEEHPSGYVRINLPNRDKIRKPHEEAEETPKRNETHHTFPTSLPDWSNLHVLHKNTLPPRASFFVYENASDAYTRDVTKSRTLSLSGKWKFHLVKSPFDAPPDFFDPKFDPTSWGSIKVPGMWQLQGYGKGPQ
jgi:beta-galactosidase